MKTTKKKSGGKKQSVNQKDEFIKSGIKLDKGLSDQKNSSEVPEKFLKDYSLLVNNLPNGFALHEVILDKDGKPCDYRFLDVNPSFEKITGLKRQDVVGKKASLVPLGIKKHWIDRLGKVAITGKPVQFESFSQLLNKHFLVNAFSPKKGYFMTVFCELGNESQVFKRYFERYLENASLILLVLDKKGCVKLINKKGAELLGFSKEEIIGKDWFVNFLPEGIRSKTKKYFREILSGKVLKDEYYENPVVTKYGTKVLLWQNTLLKDASGKIFGVISSAQDITELKQAEESLRKSNEKLVKMYKFESIIRKLNQFILECNNENEIYKRICDIFIESNLIKFVWIGLTEEGTFNVKPVAYAGIEKGYINSIKAKWDNSPHGNGPTGTAIKTQKPVIISDIRTDPRYIPWRKEALKRNLLTIVSLPLVHEGKAIGVIDIYSDRKDAFAKEDIELFKEVAGDIAIGIKSIRLEKDLEERSKQLTKAFEDVILAMAKISELRDPYTAGHQRKVAQLSTAIATKMGLPEEKVESIRLAALIHDVGKIAVPSEILTKPSKLTETEFRLIMEHPKNGYDITKDIDLPYEIASIILQHHERLDGSGYPKHLKGDKILLEARIIGVADVVEAMSSHRPYRPALGIDKALEEISINKGKLYDPDVVDACIKLFKEDGFKFKE